MPNFDTGHYFLTLLVPIKNGTMIDDQGQKLSHADRIRALLALLPTALQSPATEKIGLNSPFARNLQTHFCRMFVLDNMVYNGRTQTNGIVGRVENIDLLTPGHVDTLSTPYLAIGIDFDAVMDVGDPLPTELTSAQQDAIRDQYVRSIWEEMGIGLRQIFSNCVGFESVETANDFVDYIRRTQIETTMSFNDYWDKAPNLPSLSLKILALCVAVPFIVFILSLINLICGAKAIWPLSYVIVIAPFWGVLAGLLLTVVTLLFVYRYILARGMKAMPPGQYGDLPSVLKSLYLQQEFSDFVVKHQSADPVRLHDNFEKFLARNKPENLNDPTQPPGVISSKKGSKKFKNRVVS